MYHIYTRACLSCFDPVVWCMDRPCRYTHGGPLCTTRSAVSSRASHSRAREGAHALATSTSTRAHVVRSLSLSRVRTRGIHARTRAFLFFSFHSAAAVGRSANGYARTSLARDDDADEDADDAFVRVSSRVVSRRDARALGEDEDERETDDDAAGRRRRGRFSIRPERVADVRG